MEVRTACLGQITNGQTFRSEKRDHFEYVNVFVRVILTSIVKKQSWRRGNSFGLVTRGALGPTNFLLNENRHCFTRDAVAGM